MVANESSAFFVLKEVDNEVNKEARANWLKEKITSLRFNESVMNRLMNFLLKYGSVEKVLTEMKNLTKNETHVSFEKREEEEFVN